MCDSRLHCCSVSFSIFNTGRVGFVTNSSGFWGTPSRSLPKKAGLCGSCPDDVQRLSRSKLAVKDLVLIFTLKAFAFDALDLRLFLRSFLQPASSCEKNYGGDNGQVRSLPECSNPSALVFNHPLSAVPSIGFFIELETVRVKCDHERVRAANASKNFVDFVQQSIQQSNTLLNRPLLAMFVIISSTNQ